MTQRVSPIRTSHNSLEDSIRAISKSRKQLANRFSVSFPAKEIPTAKKLLSHSYNPSLGPDSYLQSILHSRSGSFEAPYVLERQLKQELIKVRTEIAERKAEQHAREIELQQIIQSASLDDSSCSVKSYDVEPNSVITFLELESKASDDIVLESKASSDKVEEDSECFEGCRVWLRRCECF